MDLHQQNTKLEGIKERIEVFSNTYSEVKMNHFHEEMENLLGNWASVSDQ
jgi:hypothetical protein